MQINLTGKPKRYRSKFDPTSPRAIRGLAFQKLVQEKIELKFTGVLNSREWFLSIDSCLTDYQLNSLEQMWGDVVIDDDRISHKVFVECVSLGNEESIFPDHKIRRFVGLNKYYCFGWENETRFVHSKVWNKYAGKLPTVYENYRKFNRSMIKSLRHQCLDPESLFEEVKKLM